MDLTDKTTRALLGWKLESQTNEELELKQLKAYLDATEKHGDTKANIRYQAFHNNHRTTSVLSHQIPCIDSR